MFNANDCYSGLIIAIFTLQSKSDRSRSQVTVILQHWLCYGRIECTVWEGNLAGYCILWFHFNNHVSIKVQNHQNLFRNSLSNKINVVQSNKLPVFNSNHSVYTLSNLFSLHARCCFVLIMLETSTSFDVRTLLWTNHAVGSSSGEIVNELWMDCEWIFWMCVAFNSFDNSVDW